MNDEQQASDAIAEAASSGVDSHDPMTVAVSAVKKQDWTKELSAMPVAAAEPSTEPVPPAVVEDIGMADESVSSVSEVPVASPEVAEVSAPEPSVTSTIPETTSTMTTPNTTSNTVPPLMTTPLETTVTTVPTTTSNTIPTSTTMPNTMPIPTTTTP